jgi:cadmium resistance protein CadD (predicted permease)
MQEYKAIICGQTSVQIIALALNVPVFVVGNWIPNEWILHTRNCVTVCDSLELALAKSELDQSFNAEKSADFLRNLKVNYAVNDLPVQQP